MERMNMEVSVMDGVGELRRERLHQGFIGPVIIETSFPSDVVGAFGVFGASCSMIFAWSHRIGSTHIAILLGK